MVMTAEDRYLTVAEVAGKLRVTGSAVRNWLATGKLRGLRLPSDKQGWRIKESDLADFERRLSEPREADDR